MKKNTNANLPVLIFMLALLIIWQAGAMGMNAAYILPSPTQILVRLWELRKPLFTAHLPATMLCTGVGLAISVALGLLLAIVMDASPAAERMLYHRVADHSDDRARAVICALVRLYDLEQGARDRTHHVLSDRDDGFRWLSFG
mgnify:CR=1 FL=1